MSRFMCFFHVTLPPQDYVRMETLVVAPIGPLILYPASDIVVLCQRRIHFPAASLLPHLMGRDCKSEHNHVMVRKCGWNYFYTGFEVLYCR